MILGLAKEKNILVKEVKGKHHPNGIKEKWYVFGTDGKQLIMENHNHGRSKIGLLTLIAQMSLIMILILMIN